MRITQSTLADFLTARLDAVRTAGAREELVFSIPEEPEPAARRARETHDERDHKRARERDTPAERPFDAAATAWAGSLLTPVTPPTRGPAEPLAAPLDRDFRKAGPGSDPRPERAPADGKTATAEPAGASVAVAATPAPTTDHEPDARPTLDRPTHAADSAAKARSTDAPPGDGTAPPRAAPPEGAPVAAPTSAAGAPVETVASATAQTAMEAVVVPAGALAAQAPMVAGPKNPTADPAPPEAAAPATTLPTVEGALPTVSQRQSDNGLTPVNASAPGALAEGSDPLRARLQDALRSSVHQRVLLQAASGEVVLPGLGRVAVSARSEDATVAVEVHAAQAATAQLLHASAKDIAADVLAAEIPLSSLSFTGAGAWSQSDAHAPLPERDDAPRGGTPDEAPATPPARAIPAPGGRVRIVL